MHNKIKLFPLILAADLFIVVISVLGIYRISDKAELPLKFYPVNSHLVVKENRFGKIIFPGDTVISINEKRFTSQDEIEVYLDGFKPNSFVQIHYLKNEAEYSTPVKLVKFYSNFYIITAFITGLLFILIGTFVLWKKPDNKPVKLFKWVNLGAASIIMMTWGNYSIPPAIYDYVLRIIFSFSYSLAPALFVHFTLSFPKEKNVSKAVIRLLYATGLIISIFTSIYFLRAISESTVAAIRDYLVIFNFSRYYLVACIISGLVIFIHTYITSGDFTEKKKWNSKIYFYL